MRTSQRGAIEAAGGALKAAAAISANDSKGAAIHAFDIFLFLLSERRKREEATRLFPVPALLAALDDDADVAVAHLMGLGMLVFAHLDRGRRVVRSSLVGQGGMVGADLGDPGDVVAAGLIGCRRVVLALLAGHGIIRIAILLGQRAIVVSELLLIEIVPTSALYGARIVEIAICAVPAAIQAPS